MIKSIVRLEHKIGDRVYHFLCDTDSPLGEIHDALSIIKSAIVNKIIEANASKPEEKKDDNV